LYGISAFTTDPIEKELIRPFFVSHGKIKRSITKGQYFTDLVQERVNLLKENNILGVCTDIRYAVYPKDEIFWLKQVNGGKYIHINRFDKNGSKILGANPDEIENEKVLSKMADYTLNWASSDDFSYLCDTVSVQLKDLIVQIKSKYAKT